MVAVPVLKEAGQRILPVADVVADGAAEQPVVQSCLLYTSHGAGPAVLDGAAQQRAVKDEPAPPQLKDGDFELSKTLKI